MDKPKYTSQLVWVVRCKNCKYYAVSKLKRDYTEDKRYKPSVCIKGMYAVHRSPDWYCADGEWRDEDAVD